MIQVLYHSLNAVKDVHCKRTVGYDFIGLLVFMQALDSPGNVSLLNSHLKVFQVFRMHNNNSQQTNKSDMVKKKEKQQKNTALLPCSLTEASVLARAAAKDAAAVRVTLPGCFLPAPHSWSWNPSPGIAPVMDSFFSGGRLSGRSTGDTDVVPAQWIIDLMPKGEFGGHRCQWQRGQIWS